MLFPKHPSFLNLCISVPCLLIGESAEALVLQQSNNQPKVAFRSNSLPKIATDLTTGLFVSMLVLTGATSAPAVASDAVVGSPLEPAIMQISDAAYPVLTSLSDVSTLSNKVMRLVEKKIPVEKATAALDKGIDSFLAISDETVSAFASTLQASYEGVSSNDCKATIPGALTGMDQFSSLPAVQALDATKVKALIEKFAPANKVVPKTAAGDICLPDSPKGLEQLWIGQTELTLNIPRPESRAFAGSLSTALKSVPSAEYLRLMPDFKQTFTQGTDVKSAKKFEMAGKALEKAFQKDPRIVQRLNNP